MKVYIVIGCAGDGSGSLLDQAGLGIEGVFTDHGEASDYASMGDMEIEEREVSTPPAQGIAPPPGR